MSVTCPFELLVTVVTFPLGSVIESRDEMLKPLAGFAENRKTVPSFQVRSATPDDTDLSTAPCRCGTVEFVQVPSACLENGRRFPSGVRRLTRATLSGPT